MRRVIAITAFLLLLAVAVHAQVTVEPLPQTDASTIAQINAISQEVKTLQSKLDSLPTKEDQDSSFAQLDQKITTTNQNTSLATLAYVVAALILNDLLLLAGWLLIKYHLVGE